MQTTGWEMRGLPVRGGVSPTQQGTFARVLKVFHDKPMTTVDLLQGEGQRTCRYLIVLGMPQKDADGNAIERGAGFNIAPSFICKKLLLDNLHVFVQPHPTVPGRFVLSSSLCNELHGDIQLLYMHDVQTPPPAQQPCNIPTLLIYWRFQTLH